MLFKPNPYSADLDNACFDCRCIFSQARGLIPEVDVGPHVLTHGAWADECDTQSFLLDDWVLGQRLTLTSPETDLASPSF